LLDEVLRLKFIFLISKLSMKLSLNSYKVSNSFKKMKKEFLYSIFLELKKKDFSKILEDELSQIFINVYINALILFLLNSFDS